MVRHSTRFVPYKDLKKVCAGLKAVYAAATGEAGRTALEGFGANRNGNYPMIYQSRAARWDGLSEFFKYPPGIRRAIYTANAAERLNYQLQKVTKNRLAFVSGGAIFKILYLAITCQDNLTGYSVPPQNMI
jgi:transposase-like protein